MKGLYIRPKAGTDKLLCILVSLSLLFAFSACSGDDDEEEDYYANSGSSSSSGTSNSDEEDDDDDDDDSSSTSSTNSPWNPSGYISGYSYVDLGLSVKWALNNVGANKWYNDGNYYMWGSLTYSSKASYYESNDNCPTYGITWTDDISGNSTYDVATSKWGSKWRMPTKDEWEELIEECTWELVLLDPDSIYASRVYGPNGNSIILPHSGFSLYEFSKEELLMAFYWSSTPDNTSSYNRKRESYCMYRLGGDAPQILSVPRTYGCPIRPVSDY